MKNLKVLILEDSEIDEQILLGYLRRADYEPESKRTFKAAEFEQLLAEKEWDLIVSDYEMPDFKGWQAFEILQKSGLDIPFIVVSGKIREDAAARMLSAGIADYLIKGSLARLVPVIERELKSAAVRRRQREAEKSLKESEQRYRDLFEHANDAIYTIDLQGNYTSVNKKTEELLGYSREEILKSAFCDHLNEADAKRIHQMRDQKARGVDTETRYELEINTKNGGKKNIEVSSRLIHKNGVPFEIEGISRDITSRKKLQNNLQESTKRLQLALTTAAMGVWEWNFRKNTAEWSPECYTILGQSEFGGTLEDYKKIVHPEDAERFQHLVEQAIGNRTKFSGEYRVFTETGEIRWICNQGVAEFDEHGTPLRCIGTLQDITGQKLLEQNLTATETRFRTLAENNVAGVTLCEADGKLLFANDAYLNIVGYSREDFESGKLRWTEITAPEYREADNIALEKARQNGKSDQYEKEYICKDGSRVPVLVIIALTIIGGREHFISAILDFTERKKYEKQLRESVVDFRALVNATSQAIWTITDGKSNKEFTEFWQVLTGQTYEASQGSGWLDVVHPEDRETVERLWNHSFTNRVLFNTVYRILTVAGKYNYYAVRSVPVIDESGELRKWIGAFSNITERKEVEEELRQSEARLQISQEAGRIGTWEFNIIKNELICSDMIFSFYDLENVEKVVDFELWKSFVHPDDLDFVENELAKNLQGQDTIDVEHRIISNKKRLKWISMKGRVIRQADGKVERMVGVSIDITERKTAEKNLRQSEEQLRQAQKLESIGRLAGGIAHDFNNMLTAINGYSELTLRKMNADDPLRSFIEEIKKAGERSADLTHQLLAFSRRQMLQPVSLNINQVIADTTVMLQRLIGEDVSLIEKFNAEIGQVEADPGQITQVIINLAVNARDAMPDGGTLTIETENIILDEKYAGLIPNVKTGKYILLKVSDNGTGIDDEILENIFEPFYTTKTVGSGTGLGLATVYGIINQSGGHINVRSIVNQGTTFEIYLPEIEREIAPAEKNGQSTMRLYGSETILLVEDEEIVRQLTCEILESYGYQIIEAENGEAALKICENDAAKFDLLLTDVVMPGTGGHELAGKLLEKYPNLRILFTSGYNEDSQIEYEISDAVTDFIHKPFTPDSLAEKVRSVLDRN